MSDLNLSVILSAVDRLTAPVRRIAAATRQAFAPLSKPLRDLNKRLEKAGSEARKLATRLVAAGAAAGFAFKRLFLDSAAQFERYKAMLTSIEGSSDAAERSMDWVKEFTNRVPARLDNVMDAFVRLRVFGMDPMDGTLEALVDQSAKMGGSQETLSGIILAVGQAWTKGKLQGEEALQLIERGVPVWDLLAQATGKSAQTLQELSEKGKLGRDAIKLLIQEMGKSSAGAAQAQAKTWDGMLTLLSNRWIEFANLVMDEGGVFDWLKTRLQSVLDTVNAWAASGRLEQIARQVGTRMVEAFKSLRAAMQDAWALAQQLGAGLRWLHDLFGSWKPVIIGVAAVIAGPLLLALTMAGIALGKFIFAVGSLPLLIGGVQGLFKVLGALAWIAQLLGVALLKDLVRGLAAAGMAVRAFGAALLTTPVGWILAAVAAIAGAVYLIYRNWDGISAWFTSLWDGIVETVGGSIATMMEWLETFGKVVMMPFDTLFMLYDKAKSLLPGGLLKTIGLDGPAATLGGAQRSEIGGTIRVQVDSEGRAWVREVQASGGIGIEAETGYAFGGG